MIVGFVAGARMTKLSCLCLFDSNYDFEPDFWFGDDAASRMIWSSGLASWKTRCLCPQLICEQLQVVRDDSQLWKEAVRHSDLVFNRQVKYLPNWQILWVTSKQEFPGVPPKDFRLYDSEMISFSAFTLISVKIESHRNLGLVSRSRDRYRNLWSLIGWYQKELSYDPLSMNQLS